MAYFNGGTGGYYWLGQYVPLVRTTEVYCDPCAEQGAVPLDHSKPYGKHWETSFKWAPHYGGDRACNKCGKLT